MADIVPGGLFCHMMLNTNTTTTITTTTTTTCHHERRLLIGTKQRGGCFMRKKRLIYHAMNCNAHEKESDKENTNDNEVYWSTDPGNHTNDPAGGWKVGFIYIYIYICVCVCVCYVDIYAPLFGTSCFKPLERSSKESVTTIYELTQWHTVITWGRLECLVGLKYSDNNRLAIDRYMYPIQDIKSAPKWYLIPNNLPKWHDCNNIPMLNPKVFAKREEATQPMKGAH